MSSIDVYSLCEDLSRVPDDYEVIMKIKTKYDVKAGESIAYINGIHVDHENREVYLMN